MRSELYERVRRTLFGGHNLNAFVQLLGDRARVLGPLQGQPEEFCQVLYELAGGDLAKKNDVVTFEAVEKGRKDTLKFRDGSLFRVVRARAQLGGTVIVVTPYQPSMDDLMTAQEAPLSRLVNDVLLLRDAFKRVSDEYRREELKLSSERAGAEIRATRESKLDIVLETIEKAKSGDTIVVRGIQNIDALVKLGFVPNIVDNPDAWVDAEEFPGLRYRHGRSGVEVLLTGRERFRPIEELQRLEFTFLVHRSDDAPAAFERMVRKFRPTRPDGSEYGGKEFHDDLIALVKYPEELKGRTSEDLGLMADEVGHVIDQRQELDQGILPYEAVFKKDTMAIIEHIRLNRTPAREVRKALDYFEYTGMIDAAYRTALDEQITAATAASAKAPRPQADLLLDKRVKEIVAEVLRKLPKEKLTPVAVTIALTPFVNELGFGRLVKIRERILQLQVVVNEQQHRDVWGRG
jgi:hypothetical protein